MAGYRWDMNYSHPNFDLYIHYSDARLVHFRIIDPKFDSIFYLNCLVDYLINGHLAITLFPNMLVIHIIYSNCHSSMVKKK